MANAKLLSLAAGAALALVMTGCSSAEPSDTVTTDDIVGTWGTPDTQGESTLTFEDDGSFYGNDGCNVVGGEFSLDGSTVDLGAMHSTMMFCEGVDTWLTNSTTAQLDGSGAMVFFDKDGAEVGTLDRA